MNADHSPDDPAFAATGRISSPAQEQRFDDRYRALNTLGEGGWGRVYLVEDELDRGQVLALKIILSQFLPTAEIEQRFRNEIRVLRALRHRGIPQIFNDGKTQDGELYYTMEFVEGRTLEDVLEKEAPLAQARILRLATRMLEVLEHAHAQGVVHRDLKPSNVIVSGTGEQECVKILDFGIAKVLAREGLLAQAVTMNTSVALGTPDYMSPEQVRGAPIDARTDLYALGIILYRMASGELPFEGDTLMRVLTARLEEAPRPLAGRARPAGLEKLVMSLLEREPSARPSAREVRAELATLRSKTSPGRSRRAWILATGVAVLLGVTTWACLRTDDGPSSATRGAAAPPAVARPAAAPRPDEKSALEYGVEIETPKDGDHVRTVQVPIKGRAFGMKALHVNNRTAEVAQGGAFSLRLDMSEGKGEIAVSDAAAKPGAPPLMLLHVSVDLAAPVIELTDVPGEKIDGQIYKRRVGAGPVEIKGRMQDAWPGELGLLTLNGKTQDYAKDGTFHLALALAHEGDNAFEIEIADKAGNSSRIHLMYVKCAPIGSPGAAVGEPARPLGPRAPSGCEIVKGSAIASSGWAQRVLHTSSGIELVFVPAGEFPLEGRTVHIDAPFYVARTEVTWDQYRPFGLSAGIRIRAGGGTMKPGRRRLPEMPPFHPPLDHPIVDVAFEDASAFCNWVGMRLPTADEWMYAAAGPKGLAYPWGATFEKGRCNGGEQAGQDGHPFTAPAGSYPGDVSWCGALDMAGNASEWCTDEKHAAAIVRGGSWTSDAAELSCFAVHALSERSAHSVGFRPVLDLAP